MSTNGQLSFVTYLYDEIQWTNGGRVQVGLSNDDGRRFLLLPGSRSERVRDLVTNSNVEVGGMWMYRVDSSFFIHPGPR